MEVEAAQSQRRSALRSRSGTIREPFSDCTNTISLSQSKPKTKPCPPPESKPSPAATAAGESSGDAPLPPPRPSSSSGGDENKNVFETRIVCTHKQTTDKGKDKEKIVAVPFRSYSADRVVNAGNKRKECEDSGALEPRTVPLKKIHFDGKAERRELAAMEGKASQSQRRSTLRSSKCSRSSTISKPLSDCTNTIFQSRPQSSPATVVVTRPKPKPFIQPKPQPNLTASTTNSADPSTPLPPSRSSSHSGGGNDDDFQIHTVYTRRQTAEKMKDKEKALPVPFNSYSADRIANAGKKRKEYQDMGLVEPHTVPLTKKQCLGHAASEQALKDYIQQQKAYFDEVDTFELPEEEVGSGNESD